MALRLVRLLELYRDPLAQQARHQVGRRLRVKLDVEDILQEVSLEVYRDIGKFRGSTKDEFLCWLRKILGTILLNQARHYFGTGRCNLRQERRVGRHRRFGRRSGARSHRARHLTEPAPSGTRVRTAPG